MIRPRGLVLVLFAFIPSIAVADNEKPLTRIAFGSCSHQDKPLPILKAIVAAKPELYLSLGDNIYGDTEDMKVMKEKYDKIAAIPEYQQLRKLCPHLAIWDDHDYGKNDAGADYPMKAQSQQLFLDFFDVPKDSPRRTQQGVYNAAMFGPVGKRVHVIMVDTRYFRSPLKRGKREPGMTYTPYVGNTDPKATILGAEQWRWLEAQLKQPAEVRLLVSGIQIVAEDHGFEKWMNFPAERERLFKLLRDTKVGGVIMLSGDRHLAELSMLEKAIDYPLYDLTSSGLNQASKTGWPLEKNRHRVATMRRGDNFGVITIDWSAAVPKLALQIRDIDGDITIQEKLLLSDLQPSASAVQRNKDIEAQPAPTKGAISAAHALKKVGEKVTVEMRVQATGGSLKTRFFLNSRTNFRDEENFTVVMTPNAFTGKFAKATGETFQNKVIRVTGTVSSFKDSPQIVVEEEKQIEIVEK